MNSKSYHILNGESTLHIFQESKIEGQVIVWQEIVCEGPCQYQFDEAFFQLRENFLTEFFSISPQAYQNKTKACFEELRKLNDASSVTLWYEHDLFCQLNMMASISYLHQNFPNRFPIQLVCVADLLGNYSAEEFSILESQKKDLDKSSIQFADAFWKAYCNDPFQLEQFMDSSHESFPFLSAALGLQIKRKPDNDGLNEIDKKMLALIQAGNFNKQTLVKEMLVNHNPYGFGDSQYFKYLERLSSYWKDVNGLLVSATD